MQKHKLRRFIALFFTATLILMTVNGIVSAADLDNQNGVSLTKEDAVQRAITNSTTLKDINKQLESMVEAYSGMQQGIQMIKALYEQLPKYKSLFAKNKATQENVIYSRYFDLQFTIMADSKSLVGVTDRLDEIADIIVNMPNPPEADDPALVEKAALEAQKAAIGTRITEFTTLEATLTPGDKSQILSIPEYYELQALTAQFKFMGIENPNITIEEEFEIFVYQIEVAPVSMQMGIQSMSIGYDVAKAGISNGVRQLYDSLLMLQGFYDLQVVSCQLKENTLKHSNSKYELGLTSQYDLTKAKNEYSIAILEKNKMERDIDNLELTLKSMTGLSLNTQLKLVDSFNPTIILKPMADYIQEAIKNRSEIKTTHNMITDKENEMLFTKQYFKENTVSYGLVKTNLIKQQLALEETKLSIEKEIRNAYADVLNKEESMSAKYLEYQGALKGVSNLERYMAQGFVTESAVDGYKLMAIQKETAYLTAQRSYYESLYAIEAAKGIGPAYSIGGASNEK